MSRWLRPLLGVGQLRPKPVTQNAQLAAQLSDFPFLVLKRYHATRFLVIFGEEGFRTYAEARKIVTFSLRSTDDIFKYGNRESYLINLGTDLYLPSLPLLSTRTLRGRLVTVYKCGIRDWAKVQAW